MTSLAATQQQAGFTLVEVVVALAILALSLGVVYESLGWSLRRSAAVRERERAWLVAQSRLTEMRGARPLRIGEQAGTQAGLRWTARVRAFGGERDTEILPVFEVSVQVSWGPREAQRVSLQSIDVPGLQP